MFRVGDRDKMKDTPEVFMTRNGPSKRSNANLSEKISLVLSEKVWPLNPSNIPHRSHFLNALVRICSIVILKVLRDAVTFRARGLTLTVVLAMAPMLALGTAILKGVGISEETQHFAHEFFDRIVVLSNAVEKTPPGSGKGDHTGIGLLQDSGAPKEKDGQNLVIHFRGSAGGHRLVAGLKSAARDGPLQCHLWLLCNATAGIVMDLHGVGDIFDGC